MQVNIEKRHLVIFGLVLGGIIAIISGILVFAVAPNPGHTPAEIGVPTCVQGMGFTQVLTYDSSGWHCITIPAGSGTGGSVGTLECVENYPSTNGNYIGNNFCSALGTNYKCVSAMEGMLSGGNGNSRLCSQSVACEYSTGSSSTCSFRCCRVV